MGMESILENRKNYQRNKMKAWFMKKSATMQGSDEDLYGFGSIRKADISWEWDSTETQFTV